MSGPGVVDKLQILDADLPRRLGNVRDPLVAMRMWRPAEDRHGDVLATQGSHVFTSGLAVVSAIELSNTS